MGLTAMDVKKLREATGVGMMQCKKALAETNGDFQAAVEFLRKKGWMRLKRNNLELLLKALSSPLWKIIGSCCGD